MIPQSTINACVKAWYGSLEDTDYGKIQAVLMLYDQLRTAASEGGSEPFAHLVMTEWNSIAWWTTESAERAQKEADELMRYDSKRKLTVVTVYTHPPEVARDALLRDLLDADQEYDKALQRMPTKFLGRGYANGLDRIERAKDRRQRVIARAQAAISGAAGEKEK